MSSLTDQGGETTDPLAGCIALAGSTAVGKSEVALLLAERSNGEIISVDSMQVYRGMDIGTAKPSASDRARVRHHLIDVVSLSEPFDAALWVRSAQAAISEIKSRGKTPILCGGTGLYFMALFGGLGEAPPSDAKLRRALEALPLSELLEEMAAADPVLYGSIDRNNPRRVIRAIEVIRLTGKPFSGQRANWRREAQAAAASPRAFALARSSADLHARIDARVNSMFQNGLVAETKQLLAHGLGENRTALQALGYRQVVEHLQGLRSLAQTIELVKIRTRQFAKRQMTWFRRQGHWLWVKAAPGDSATDVLEQIGRASSV
jgi:tRNA dimethylallyltransferase